MRAGSRVPPRRRGVSACAGGGFGCQLISKSLSRSKAGCGVGGVVRGSSQQVAAVLEPAQPDEPPAVRAATTASRPSVLDQHPATVSDNTPEP
jgi:hypothetical protein